MPGFLSSRRARFGAGAVVLGAAAFAAWFARDRLMDSPKPHQALIARYCRDCHNSTDLTANLSFDHADFTRVGDHPDLWEAVVRKLRVGMMPPADAPQPGNDERADLVAWLERRLNRAAADHPDPGPSLLRRLN